MFAENNNMQTDMRQEKGKQIAATCRIVKTNKGWEVPSQSGHGKYLVYYAESLLSKPKCTCPDHEIRNCKCKHIWAVEYIATKVVDAYGNVTETHTVRKTYSQDWKNYNLAQEKEKELFMMLLADITARIRQPAYTFGRPNNLLADMIYSMVFKTYSTFSGRRFSTDMQRAKDLNYVEKKIPRSSMFDYFNKKELTSLLCDIVTLTSLPLQTVEKDFAVDSTGFGTSSFQRWYSFKHGKDISSRRWVKCHFMTGVKTNIISSVKVTSEFENDSPELKVLVSKTAENFDMEEVSADKAYSSRDNLALIESMGATPFIPFKENASETPKGVVIWRRMYHYYMLNRDEFLEHYHKRSSAESTVHMIKSKFGDYVRNKVWIAQVNEVLCKVICHNISCVIMEMHTMGIKPDFYVTNKNNIAE